MKKLGRKKNETIDTKNGQIKVTVQTEKRMEAINNMAMAINKLSDALTTGTRVHLTGCNFYNTEGSAVNIETLDEVTETLVYKTDDKDQEEL